MGSWLGRIYHILSEILIKVNQVATDYVRILARLNAIESKAVKCCQNTDERFDNVDTKLNSMDKKLDHIIDQLTPPPPVKFKVTLTHI